MTETYLQYGISVNLANRLDHIGIPKTTLANTSKKNLRTKYDLTDNEIEIIKDAITRKPIDLDIIHDLLSSSNYTCCICKGIKSKSYLIHHIEEYSVSQNNNYDNLAVLCPDDHDLAHKKGKSLSLKLTSEQILREKYNWEKKVREINIQQASRNGNITEIDFLNVPRIVELYQELFKRDPITEYTNELYNKNLVMEDGLLNKQGIEKVNKNPITPLIFFAPYGSSSLRRHYYDIFQEILDYLSFVDLDTLLNKKSLKEGILGRYCFYVGGLYSSSLPSPISEDSELMKFYFKRRHFVSNFLVDPKYFCSSSAKWRTSHRGTYMIFGKIRNVEIETLEGQKKIILDIRPYCFGLPDLEKHRTPAIACRDEFDDIFDEE